MFPIVTKARMDDVLEIGKGHVTNHHVTVVSHVIEMNHMTTVATIAEEVADEENKATRITTQRNTTLTRGITANTGHHKRLYPASPCLPPPRRCPINATIALATIVSHRHLNSMA